MLEGAENLLRGLRVCVVTILSEVPCRVSSDVHERRNERKTVSSTNPVKL
jgi:hypothetical protein